MALPPNPLFSTSFSTLHSFKSSAFKIDIGLGDSHDAGQPREQYQVEQEQPHGLKFAPGASAHKTRLFTVGDKVITTRPNFHFSNHISGICQFPFHASSIVPHVKNSMPRLCCQASLRASTSFPENRVAEERSSISVSSIETIPKIDKSGKFCSPRAARELALSIVYAACLEGSDPVRLFEKRLNSRRESGYEFDKTSLMEYNHMSFGGPPVTVETIEEADELLRKDERDSTIEAEILAAPPKMVYSKLILRFTRKLLVAVVDGWDNRALKIEKVIPPTWKNKPAGRILELCILHLAMSEITVIGTRHQIVINEAVDLAKRFCDGAAPRIINGCLRTFVKDIKETDSTPAREKQEVRA
ncbi:NusB/RsmB/TIM44 [Cucumis melo var. makuwa]|uniref:NusB/RsmB/TIM44 n=1 Tax=Cucumis melo var. makuwa TaxID=1194695 RepID=A0A5D3DDJ4_CUCMM|nr:NusB/RsmB/TIM44 [Cucumis melo var. makuwa]